MFVLEDDEGRIVKLFVVDVHTHIGKEKVLDARGETFRSNTPRQTVDFYHRLQFELKAFMEASPSKYRYKLSDPPTEPPSALKWFYDALGGMWGWTVDQFVTFPFNDYRAYSTTPSFQTPNNMVLKRSLTAPFSPRIIGFVRVDPHDGDAAIREVERCALMGARGLKLHPISQGFLDEITSKEVREVVATAINNGLPVLFDCRYYATAEDIYELVQEIKGDVKRKNFAVVLGHSGMEYTRKGIYDILGDPNIYGDTSGVRGDDVPVFFKMLKNNIENWSRKVLFGTDYNYFTIPQAVDFLSYLFTWEFYDEAKLKDVERILGGNALSIIKPHNHPSSSAATAKLPKQGGALTETLFRKAGEAVKAKKLKSITYDPLISKDGRVDPDSFITSLKGESGATILLRKGGKEIVVHVLNLQDIDSSLRVRGSTAYKALLNNAAPLKRMETEDLVHQLLQEATKQNNKSK